jgi:predicted nucleic acid-binding protein
MFHYFDSSFLLSIIMHDENYSEARKIWDESSKRFSSILLKIETLTVIRRTYLHNITKLADNWLTVKENEYNNLIEEVNIRTVDQEIYNTIRLKKVLSKCRSLDAIHIATALEFEVFETNENPFILCTYDKNMHVVAKEIGLNVFPLELIAK